MKMIFRILLLVVASSGSAEELPKLTDYPVRLSNIDYYAKAIVPEVHSGSRCIRDLRYDRAEAPNFADRFTLFITGCGSGCAEFCVIDRTSGAVFPGFCFVGGPKFEFARDSRMIIVRHIDGLYEDSNPYFADCYVWEENRFRFLGRWATTYGVAQKDKAINWTRNVVFAPNPPNWRSTDRSATP